ncbi:MAG: hypothetical protein UT66_C0022G0006 [candidate division CPR2 bacterium GW2011_GWC1_39_9]|nr:MAG: hypothetical protein UT66_C0022G0006 [candidate division CPR2 bacterium GW2011_GWC1_39_9]
MFPIFLRTIKNKRTAIIAYIVSGIAFLLMYIPIYPSFASSGKQLVEIMKNYPQGFLKAFGIEDIAQAFLSLEGYLSTEHFGFVWPLVLIFLALSFAGNSIAGEIEKGTMEVVLSQPISRLKIYFGKYLGGLGAIVLFVTTSIFASIPIAAIFNVHYVAKGYIYMTILGVLFGIAIYGLAMLCSSFASDKGKANFMTGGVLIAMYVLNILSGLKSNLDDLKYLSFFHYFNASGALLNYKIDSIAILVFVLTTIIASSQSSLRTIRQPPESAAILFQAEEIASFHSQRRESCEQVTLKCF